MLLRILRALQKACACACVCLYVFHLNAYALGNAAVNEPSNPFSLPKDGSYYLKQYAPMLRSYVEQVKKQSLEQDYPYYDRRPVIEYSVYRTYTDSQKLKWRGGLVLIGAYMAEFIKYSHLGGVGVGARLTPNSESFYLSFDGRYLSDLESFGLGQEIFAYCVLPRFDKCILLGIGEEW